MPMLVEAWISWPVEVERPGYRRQDLVGQGDHFGGLADLRLHEGEFVAAQPGQRVGGADRGGDPLCDSAQQLVADGVAQGVVDVPEAIEVEQQDRNHAALAAGAGQLLAEPIVQQGPVGQAGEPIVQGQTPDHVCAEPDRSVPERAQAQPIDATYQHGLRAEAGESHPLQSKGYHHMILSITRLPNCHCPSSHGSLLLVAKVEMRIDIFLFRLHRRNWAGMSSRLLPGQLAGAQERRVISWKRDGLGCHHKIEIMFPLLV